MEGEGKLNEEQLSKQHEKTFFFLFLNFDSSYIFILYAIYNKKNKTNFGTILNRGYTEKAQIFMKI